MLRDASEPDEPYIDGPALEAAMRVSASTLKRWRKEGMPFESWGMARTRRYQLSKSIAWARARNADHDDQSACG